MGSGQHYITDDRFKYIWYPGIAEEQLFDLKADPMEIHNMAGEPEYVDDLARLRRLLVQELEGRPEGFVRDGELVQTEGDAPFCLPGYERKPW
jgi:hypothetical protein